MPCGWTDLGSERPWNPRLAADYDAVAAAYAAAYDEELAGKPFDREILDRFCGEVTGLVCDAGSGPGQVARYLTGRGTGCIALDLSWEMARHARGAGLPAVRGDLRALPFADGSLGGLASFYAVIHLPRLQLSWALREMQRVLRAGGKLLLAFHAGEGELHADEWFGSPVSMDATLFSALEVAGQMEEAGLRVEAAFTREPYEFEHPTSRAYLLATRA